METGKWIVMAFLTGVIVIGFRTRSLKSWEFISSGLFVLLLDQLVFHGQISSWVGNLGSNVKGAAGHGIKAGLAAPLLLPPGGRAKLAAFARAMWANRPGLVDYLLCGAALVVARDLLQIGWAAAVAVVPTVLVLVTVWAAVTDLRSPAQHDDQADSDVAHLSGDSPVSEPLRRLDREERDG